MNNVRGRKGLQARGISALEVLEIALRSLDCGRDGCSVVSGGCSNSWGSMIAREGGQEALSSRQHVRFQGDTHVLHFPGRVNADGDS